MNKVHLSNNSVLLAFTLLLFVCSPQIVFGIVNEDPQVEELIKGVIVFKVVSELATDLSHQDGVERFGVLEIDNFMKMIGATWVEKRFPFIKSAEPGKTDLTRIYNLYFPEDYDPYIVSEDISKIDGVEYAHPWYLNYVFLDHNDPDRDQQYYLDLVLANEAHDYSTGSEDIVIAIVDTGMDMNHEDLRGNLWFNPNEEANGRDDDNNGLIDDIHGWNFNGNSNDMTDTYGHGTHVAGLASAVTNNRVGIASIGYSCKLMVVKVGQGPGISHGYQGIAYAASMGAHVINNSWGGARAGEADREAVVYAYEQNSVDVCASGNNNRSTRMYPAGFDEAFAVSSTDRNDVKSGFSNYGNWVHISAPGTNIYSTYRNNGYSTLSGTSMASPQVAGAAAIIRTEFPDFNVEAVQLALQYGADDIEEQNPNHRGMLGSGRLNLLRSLRAIEYPILRIVNFEMIGGHRPNRLEPGSRADLVLTLSNLGQPTEEVTAVLYCDDDEVELLVSEVEIPNIGSGETISTSEVPFRIQVAEDVIPRTFRFEAVIYAQPGDIVNHTSIEILVGDPAVFIVDDDDGDSYELVIMEALRRITLGYQSHDVLREGIPSSEPIAQHPLTVWITGHSSPQLDGVSRHSMQIGMQQGGNILLMGKWIGDYFENQPFLRQNFNAYHQLDSVSATHVRGYGRIIPEDVVLWLYDHNEEEMDTLNPDARLSPSTQRPGVGADTLLVYMDGDQVVGIAGVSYHNRETGSRSIYLGFNLEMASDEGPYSRAQMLAYMFDWMTNYQSIPSEDELTPMSVSLLSVYPNPFNQSVRIGYEFNKMGVYRLEVYDIAGRKVDVLWEGMQPAGLQHFVWNPVGLPSGNYFLNLSEDADNQNSFIRQRVTLLR